MSNPEPYWGAGRLCRKLIDHIKESAHNQRTAITQSAGTETVLLEEALVDLRASPDEAKDEDLPIPSTKALQNGEHVLREMYSMWCRRFEVYPMPNGEIAIDAPTGPGRSILIICDSEGGALCAVNFDRTYRRARYSDARMLPDGFLRDAIRDLTSNV